MRSVTKSLKEVDIQHTFPMDVVSRKPPTISFLAVSCTAVASRDLNRRFKYLFSETFGSSGSCGLVEGKGALECEENWWPHVLHFVGFNFVGTKTVQVHTVLLLEAPLQIRI